MSTSSILSILDKVSLGTQITVYFDSAFRTGKYQGIKDGNVVITTSAGITVYIPLRKVEAVTF
ncbi:hypothetical protein [Paenibacillus rigui]|uniref:DUF2642 domain-containing protein n=1 Tax=Paenibacillus rigui TaxID=554312 RepID=A0A229UJS5_9BACL|nr:hypothetical protein [Paenibacillus rigui]OXM83554.1 hypothetical protein CF651_24915 [Paenibacillus rigui]